MKTIKRILTIHLFTVIFLLLANCDNQDKIEKSKGQNLNETKSIEDERLTYKAEIESLETKIELLAKSKSQIESDANYNELEIYRILETSYLDHVIVGSKDLNKSSELFSSLGFSIKDGYKHKNGIKNNFIEFTNNSELEIIEVSDTNDELSKNYKTLIEENISGLQFAIRVHEIDQLKNSFDKLDYPFSKTDKNNFYSTLFSKSINTELPIFFIKYNKENNNTEVNHTNKTKGIKSIWFETKDIKKSAGQLVDFGFAPIGNYKIPSFNNKVVEFRNNNFGIILIESNKYEISGITISIESLSELQQIMNKNFDRIFLDKIIKYGKSIFLPREITKSLWLEFVGEK